MEGYSPIQKVPQIASSKKSSKTSLFLTLQPVKGYPGGPPIPDPILPVRVEYSSQGFSGESLPAALQGFEPSSKTCCCGCRQPVNSRQLLETSQKAKAFQDTQRLWPTAQGAGNALCSQLPFRFCALGAWQWPNHVGTWCDGPGAGAPPVGSSRMLISDSAWVLFLSLFF